MSKAFDTISHKSVIEGVMSIVPVVDPAVVNVIINFLQNRALYTSLNGLDSTVLYTNQGVPQGTVLGPPLYNCSTHDIDVSDISTTLSTYDDDNNPLVAGSIALTMLGKLLVRSVTNLTQETCFSMFKNLPRKCVSFST